MRRAVARFFAHDVPDFLGWCAALRARLPGLRTRPRDGWADDRPSSSPKRSPDADAVVVESLAIDRHALAPARRGSPWCRSSAPSRTNVDRAACAARGVRSRPCGGTSTWRWPSRPSRSCLRWQARPRAQLRGRGAGARGRRAFGSGRARLTPAIPTSPASPGCEHARRRDPRHRRASARSAARSRAAPRRSRWTSSIISAGRCPRNEHALGARLAAARRADGTVRLRRGAVAVERRRPAASSARDLRAHASPAPCWSMSPAPS